MAFFQQELPKKSRKDQKIEGYKDHDQTKKAIRYPVVLSS